MSITGIPELRESYRKLGAVRFWLIMAGTLAWIGAGAALSISLRYPQAFGSNCHRKCMIESYWYSPELLHHGGPASYALFVWLWSMPALVIGALISAFIMKRGIFKKSGSE